MYVGSSIIHTPAIPSNVEASALDRELEVCHEFPETCSNKVVVVTAPFCCTFVKTTLGPNISAENERNQPSPVVVLYNFEPKLLARVL
jgi:hypothetical protein